MTTPITLATLEQATEQQVFDQVVAHLRKQGAKAKGSTGGFSTSCVYRNDAGLKCAAGCLIGDDEYNKCMENKTWVGLVGKGFAPEKHCTLVTDLQRVHDRDPVEKWEDSLEAVASYHRLDYTPPEG